MENIASTTTFMKEFVWGHEKSPMLAIQTSHLSRANRLYSLVEKGVFAVSTAVSPSASRNIQLRDTTRIILIRM